MRYSVTDRFYNELTALYAIAIEDGNALEMELVYDLLMNTVQDQESK